MTIIFTDQTDVLKASPISGPLLKVAPYLRFAHTACPFFPVHSCPSVKQPLEC